MQPPFAQRAQSEIQKDFAAEAGRPVSDFTLLGGDIRGTDAPGMSPTDLATVRAEATILFHLAAIYDLAVAQTLALSVNLDGTHNVNAFARSLPALAHYHYVSTCYVAGKRTGRILERELRHEAGFRNCTRRRSTWRNWKSRR